MTWMGDQGKIHVWNDKADCAFPSAVQSEINSEDALNLVRNGLTLLNMSIIGESLVTVMPDRVETLSGLTLLTPDQPA